jgi:signal transduction histidine kinase
MDTLLQLGADLAAGLPIDELVARLAAGSQEILDCEAVLLLERQRDRLQLAASAPALEGNGVWIPLSQGPAGRALASGAPVRLDEAWLEPLPGLSLRAGNLLCLPLVGQGKALGVLEAVNRRGGPFTDEDLRLGQGLAGLAAMLLDSRRLRQALGELEAGRTRIITLLAHELRTPLACIRGAAEMLSDPNLDSPDMVAEMADMIVGESEQMTRILEDLFMVSELEKEEEAANLLLEPVYLTQICQEKIEQFQPFHSEHAYELEVLGVAHGAPVVLGDRVKLGHCVFHLLDNATKFSPEGGTVQVKVQVEPEVVKVSVSDPGVGIPPEQQDRIFERFYQVEQRDNRSFEGLGLGLYICRTIVERHQGRLSCQSQPGKGSTFTAEFPRYRG